MTPAKNKPLTDHQQAALARLVEGNCTYKQAGTAIGVSEQACRGIITSLVRRGYVSILGQPGEPSTLAITEAGLAAVAGLAPEALPPSVEAAKEACLQAISVAKMVKDTTEALGLDTTVKPKPAPGPLLEMPPAPAPTPTSGYAQLPPSAIDPNPDNPRKAFPAGSLTELADSIRANGLIEPLVVVPVGERYMLIAGERRWRACQLAGLNRIDCRIMQRMDPAKAKALMLIENLQREDLNPVEQAEGFRALTELGYKQGQIAQEVGLAQPTVANALRLLELPDETVTAIRNNLISASHGRALARWADTPALCRELTCMAIAGLSAKQLEKPSTDLLWRIPNREKLLHEVHPGTYSWQEGCKGCNRITVFHGTSNCGGNHCCTDLECFEAKRLEAAKAEEAQRDTESQQALESEVPDLGKVNWNQYRELPGEDGFPGICPADCEHKRKAVKWDGQRQCWACFNPECYKAKAAEVEATAKVQAADATQLALESVLGRLDGQGVDGKGLMRRCAVLMAWRILAGQGKHLRAAVKRMGLGLDMKALRPDNLYAEGAQESALAELYKLEYTQLLALTAEVLLRQDVQEARRAGDWRQADWFLSDAQPGQLAGSVDPAATDPRDTLSEEDRETLSWMVHTSGEDCIAHIAKCTDATLVALALEDESRGTPRKTVIDALKRRAKQLAKGQEVTADAAQ